MKRKRAIERPSSSEEEMGRRGAMGSEAFPVDNVDGNLPADL